MMTDLSRVLPVLVSALLLAACADAESPPMDDGTAAQPDLDAQVDRLTDGSSPKAIYLVANQFALGEGVDQDQQMAERLWLRACRLEHMPSCSIYGSRMIGAGELDAAAPALESAAQAGDVEAVRNLIQLHSDAGWHGASFAQRLHWMEVLQALGENIPGQPAEVQRQ